MVMAYAPFDNPRESRPPSAPQRLMALPAPESTECNWLVMFFVVGVFALALSDSLKSSK